MYSMVMVMALSGTAAVPAFGGHGCHGSSGCSGYYGCSGSSCGGSCHGGHRLFSCFNKGNSCHGSYGCSGSCSGCHGSYGCSGSCHGGHRLFGGHGGHGCHGSCSGYSNCCGSVMVGCTGGHGCTGGYGAPMGAPMGAPPAAAPAPAEKGRAEPRPPAALNAAPAKVLVTLPVDASLTIDGQATTSTGATREFVSPALENGKAYVYTIKVDVSRDGKTVSESKTVYVRAGETSEVSFGLSTVASN